MDPLEYIRKLKEELASIPDETRITKIADEVAKKILDEVRR